MIDKFRKNEITKKQIVIVAALTAGVGSLALLARHRYYVSIVSVAGIAVQDWIDELDAKDFKVFIVNKEHAVVYDRAMKELAYLVAS